MPCSPCDPVTPAGPVTPVQASFIPASAALSTATATFNLDFAFFFCFAPLADFTDARDLAVAAAFFVYKFTEVMQSAADAGTGSAISNIATANTTNAADSRMRPADVPNS